jgi:hypothetical protein
MGVIFWIYNAAFALVLLVLVLIASGYAIFDKNPDNRYHPMRDDRGSFIKSATNLNTELDALGVTARGDMRMKRDLDSDSDSFTSTNMAKNGPFSVSRNGSTRNVDQYGQAPQSPIDPSAPFIPASGQEPRHGTPSSYNRNQFSGSALGQGSSRGLNTSPPPAPRFADYQAYDRSQSLRSGTPTGFRPGGASGGSAWQRGAGYDH